MYYQYLPKSDLSAIACKTRRIDKDDPVYKYIYEMLREEIGRTPKPEDCFETASRRHLFREFIERQIENVADRNIVVANALTAARCVVEGKKADDVHETVTEVTYAEKVNELVDLLSRLNPSDQEVYTLARRLPKQGTVYQAQSFLDERLENLTIQATAMYHLSKANKLVAFNDRINLNDAVHFALYNDAVNTLYKFSRAGEAGEVVGVVIGFALVLAAILGCCVGITVALTAIISLNEFLGLGVVLGTLALICSNLDVIDAVYNTAAEKIYETSAHVVGDAVTQAVMYCTPEPDPCALYV